MERGCARRWLSVLACAAVTPAVHGVDFTPERDLRGFEPSYFMYAFDDDDHLEFRISI
jgi:hypothetical protein